MIEFGCKNCGQKLSVQDQHSGKRVKCPKCGSVCVVPDNSDKIKFNCQNCGQSIRVPQIYAGKKGKCPKCKNPVVVPSLKKEPADGAGIVSVVCSMCNEAVQVPETSRGQTIECPECGSYIETSSRGALSGSDASVPPRSDEDLYQEETEEYEESEGVDRRIIVGISAVAAVVVVGLIILAAVLRSSRSRPAERPEGLRGQQQLADGGAKTTVKLLDPGAQPRTALRYKFQANRTEKMVMETSMAMAMEIGDQKRPETQVPATRMTVTIDSKEVSPEGDLHYEFELEQVEVLPKPGANPAMINAMKQQMSSMLGLSGSATVTSRGFTKDVEIKPPPGIDPQIRQSMDEMKQSMNQMSAPLPEEPVGIGARWQVTMPVETAAMKLTQVATYTLSQIQGDKAKVDITIKQSAPPQEIDTPGAAPGVKVSLESLKSSGKGTVELQMTNLVGTYNLNMTTTYIVSANNQKIKTTMRVGMKIHPQGLTSLQSFNVRGTQVTEAAATDVKVVISERPSATRYIPKQPAFAMDAHSLAMSGRRLTAEEVESIEKQIEKNPRDITSRTKLLGYYFGKQYQNQSAREAKRKHVLWLILNSPESEVLATPHGGLDAISDTEAYSQGKKAWINQLKRRPANLKLLENSANFFLVHDRDLAKESLQTARSLDMDNPKWPTQLGRLYSLDMIGKSLKVKTNAAGKALEQYEIAYKLSTDRGRNRLLQSLAKVALAANKPQKAKEYAEIMLSQKSSSWNYGNNIHHGNIILGRIALKLDDLEEAKKRLINAGKTPGSPVLNSFGPNMALAKELLQKGEKDVVLKYFELCLKFWYRKELLHKWSVVVKNGKIPDFGNNLNR